MHKKLHFACEARKMDMSSTLSFESVCARIKAGNREQILKHFYEELRAAARIDEATLKTAASQRKRLKHACLGDGLAVFDFKAKGLKSAVIMLATLESEADFGAPDNQPVSIVAFILSPEREGPVHLRRLSRVVRMLKQPNLRKNLKKAESELEIRALLGVPEGDRTLAA